MRKQSVVLDSGFSYENIAEIERAVNQSSLNSHIKELVRDLLRVNNSGVDIRNYRQEGSHTILYLLNNFFEVCNLSYELRPVSSNSFFCRLYVVERKERPERKGAIL